MITYSMAQTVSVTPTFQPKRRIQLRQQQQAFNAYTRSLRQGRKHR